MVNLCLQLQVFILLVILSILIKVLNAWWNIQLVKPRITSDYITGEIQLRTLKSIILTLVFSALVGYMIYLICKGGGKFSDEIAWIVTFLPFAHELYVHLVSSLQSIVHGSNGN